MSVVFNKAYYSSDVLENIKRSFDFGVVSGKGYHTQKCVDWFLREYGNPTLLVHSCTAALEIAAILMDLKAGDEVIMPSYTFVSTANAFVLRGAIPVFVDVREDNFNIDESKIEAAITEKTKVIVPVHYAGVACDMDVIMDIAERHNLGVVEDAAQAFGATYKGRKLGSIGDFGCLSFHETKNISSGEGGALIINNISFKDRAEILIEKGTNRSKFFRGEVDKYTWVDLGSSYIMSDILAAYLYTQLIISDEIQNRRLNLWQRYYEAFKPYEKSGRFKLAIINDFATNNGHMFYLVFESVNERNEFLDWMKEHSIMSTFHYVPLHSSPAGLQYCRYIGEMKNTKVVSETLARLPLFESLTDEDISKIIDVAVEFLSK